MKFELENTKQRLDTSTMRQERQYDDPRGRTCHLSIHSLHDMNEHVRTGTPGTLIEGFSVYPDSENLKFRISPLSCRILGSGQKKQNQVFNFQEPYSSFGGNAYHSENSVSPVIMVVESLKNRLLKCHKNLVSKAKAQDYWAIDEQETVDCSEELHQLFNTDFSKLDSDQRIDLILSSKKISMAFQQLVWTCWLGQFSELSHSIVKGIKRLIYDPLGNYVLQKIIEKDQKVREAAEDFCMEDFGSLCQDQYASRVIQCLIETSEYFRVFSTDFFREHVWSLIDSMPSIYLFVTIIKCSKDDQEIDFVRNMIAKDYKSVIESKYMKRIVVSYLIKVQEEKLAELFLLFKLKRKLNFVKLFNDKFLPYVLLTFICRSFSPAVDLLQYYIQNNFKQLLKTKHFMFVIMKVMTIDSISDKSHMHNCQIVDSLADALCHMEHPDFNNQRFSYFCYSFLTQSRIIKKKSLSNLVAFIEKGLDILTKQTSYYQFNIRRAPTL